MYISYVRLAFVFVAAMMVSNQSFLLYDLERQFSFYIMTYTGPMREEVISTALDINRYVDIQGLKYTLLFALGNDRTLVTCK